MKKILIIQTAFIGDVVLATALVEQIRDSFPRSQIHFLLRKGNEVLLKNNPHISNIWIWDKKNKYKSLFKNVMELRKIKFDYLFNLQRFFNSGLMMSLIKAKYKSCFSQNPLSFFADSKIEHTMDRGVHEIDRNVSLLPAEFNSKFKKPRIYAGNDQKNEFFKRDRPYVVMAPNSVWQTKQWPKKYWRELALKCVHSNIDVHFVGAPGDFENCEELRKDIMSSTYNHCGEMSLYDSANLMRGSKRVFANDSSALHLASAVNTPSTGIFCSTTKSFGFFGVSDDSVTLERLDLDCKPCGLHGKKQCPLQHFNCGEVPVELVFKSLNL